MLPSSRLLSRPPRLAEKAKAIAKPSRQQVAANNSRMAKATHQLTAMTGRSRRQAVFVNPADFGETALLDGQPVRCIFDREYAADNGYGISAGNADPYLICLSAELPDTVAEAEIQVRGIAYRVAEVQADGTGITVLQLRAKNEPAPTY